MKVKNKPFVYSPAISVEADGALIVSGHATRNKDGYTTTSIRIFEADYENGEGAYVPAKTIKIYGREKLKVLHYLIGDLLKQTEDDPDPEESEK